jgi:hypothetical protein
MYHRLTFSETEIQKLFGHEAAEDEAPARLRQYYFKNDVYDRVTADLPVRILVGHKGVGKSALFKVAIWEAQEAGSFPVLIRPDDIVGLGADTSDFLQAIRDWKRGLLTIVSGKLLSSLKVFSPGLAEQVGNTTERLLGELQDRLRQSMGSAGGADRTTLSKFLGASQVPVFIDDLDRGWEGRRQDVRRISALLNAVRDLSNGDHGMQFKISLRSDVYYLVRTSDESTDKIEGSVIWHFWTNHQILVLLVKRIVTFFGRSVDEANLMRRPQAETALALEDVMEARFRGKGHWENAPMHRVLMSLIRKRPRDLVKLLTLAARHARDDNSSLIRTQHLEASFEEYSQGRIQDTINEFRSELPNIERLLLNMKPSRPERRAKLGYVYTTAALLSKITNIMQGQEFRFSTGPPADQKELAAFMYKINFLTARKDLAEGGITRKYFEENRYLSNQFADFGFDWEIHPAYRWALQPDDWKRDVSTTLQLEAEAD